MLLATQSKPRILLDLGKQYRTASYFQNTQLFQSGSYCTPTSWCKTTALEPLVQGLSKLQSLPQALLCLSSLDSPSLNIFKYVCKKGTSCFSATMTSVHKGRVHSLELIDMYVEKVQTNTFEANHPNVNNQV